MPDEPGQKQAPAQAPTDAWDAARFILLFVLSHGALAVLIHLVGAYAALLFPLVLLASIMASFAAIDHVKKHAFGYLVALFVGLALLGLGLAGKLDWAIREIQKDFEKMQARPAERKVNP